MTASRAKFYALNLCALQQEVLILLQGKHFGDPLNCDRITWF